jgi:hypothetical protein
MQYDFECLECRQVATENEWNQYTYEKCNHSPGTSYKYDENFFTLNREWEEGEGAWFHCPNCDYYHNSMNDVSRVPRRFHSNHEARYLLERSF